MVTIFFSKYSHYHQQKGEGKIKHSLDMHELTQTTQLFIF